jgi:hypothetical protein
MGKTSPYYKCINKKTKGKKLTKKQKDKAKQQCSDTYWNWKIKQITEEIGFQDHTMREEGWRQCKKCKGWMNPVEVAFSGKSGLCGRCIKKLHKKTIGKR